eukprot:gene8374-10288_t
MYVSSVNGVDNSTCGYVFKQPCKSIKSALNNFIANNVHDYQSQYPSLMLELEYGDYTGPDNNEINLYQYDITIKPTSKPVKNLFNIVNLQPHDENSTIFQINTSPNDRIPTKVVLEDLHMDNCQGSFLVSDHTSQLPSPISLQLNGISISGSVPPLNGFLFFQNSTLPFASPFISKFNLTISNCVFSNNISPLDPPREFLPQFLHSIALFNGKFEFNQLLIESTTFSFNNAQSIVKVYGFFSIVNSSFLNNQCNTGCLDIRANGGVIRGSSFIRNNDTYSGSILKITDLNNIISPLRTLVIDSSTFIENSSKYGSTFTVYWSNMDISNSTITTQMDTPFSSNFGRLISCYQSKIAMKTSQLEYRDHSPVPYDQLNFLLICDRCEYSGQLENKDLCPPSKESSESPRGKSDDNFNSPCIDGLTMYVSPDYGVNSKNCGYTQNQSCRSIKFALNNFKNNNVTNYQIQYPSLTLELDLGDYTGPDNNEINLYQYDITIKPTTTDNNKFVNLHPVDENSTIFHINTLPNDRIPTNVILSNLHMDYTKGAFLISNHTSQLPSPISLQLNGISISGSVPSFDGLLVFFNTTKKNNFYPTNFNLTVSFCTFFNNTSEWWYPSKYSILEPKSKAVFTSLLDFNQLVIESTTFSQNTAFTIANIYGYAQIINSQFLNNTCAYGTIIFGEVGTIIGSTFLGNNATVSGGALVVNSQQYTNPNNLTIPNGVLIESSSFISNYAMMKGGTFSLSWATLNITSSTIEIRDKYKSGSELVQCYNSVLNMTSTQLNYLDHTKIPNSELNSVILCDSEDVCKFYGQLSNDNICIRKKDDIGRTIVYIVFVYFIIPIFGFFLLIAGIVFLILYLRRRKLQYHLTKQPTQYDPLLLSSSNTNNYIITSVTI